MFCPVCRDEYRPGFTRCATCDVDLVPSLDAATPKPPAAVLPEVAAEEATVNFCGFLTLDEALDARATVRGKGMRAEILICDAPKLHAGAEAKDEYWLRVTPRDFKSVAQLVGYQPAATTAEAGESFLCSACGATVGPQDAACPGCGLAFE